MDIFKAVVFALHFFFFGLTVLFFLLKFHKKKKTKPFIIIAGIIWIIFGMTDFILELKSVLSMFI